MKLPMDLNFLDNQSIAISKVSLKKLLIDHLI